MDLATQLAPITQDNADMNDPRQHVAWALTSFPSPNPEMGSVPIPPPVPMDLSELLFDLGFRHNPELQRKWFIPGDHPEGGYLNVPKVVTREQHDEWLAQHADPDGEAEKWRATAEVLLGKLDPKMAQRIADMTPEQKAQAREVHRDNLPAAFARLADLAEGDE